MSEEENTSKDSDQDKTLNTLKKFQKHIAKMDDHFNELFDAWAIMSILSVIFSFIGFMFGWFGGFSAILWSGIYIGGAIAGLFFSLILNSFVKNWLVCVLGYVLPIIGIVWISFTKLDPTLNISINTVLLLLILIFSKNAFNKKEREYHELRISSDLQNLLKDYDMEKLDSDLCAMLDEAVHDRMDIHEKIYIIHDHDHIIEGIGVLEDVDDALFTLLKQAKTIMQLRKRVSRAEKNEDSDISLDDHLYNKLNELTHQFTQKKRVLHELTIDVLGIENEQIAIGIQALQKKRAEIALVEKRRKDQL